MADRRPKLLFDAIAAIDAALGFLAGQELAAFEANLLLRSGVERQLEILGEACARLLREDASIGRDVRASRMAIGLRNRIIHGYDGIDNETVYRTVLDDLPKLRGDLASLLARLDPPA